MEDVKTFYKRKDVNPVKEVKFTDLELGEHFITGLSLCIKIAEDKYYDISDRIIVEATNPNFCVKAVALNATWNYIYE